MYRVAITMLAEKRAVHITMLAEKRAVYITMLAEKRAAHLFSLRYFELLCQLGPVEWVTPHGVNGTPRLLLLLASPQPRPKF